MTCSAQACVTSLRSRLSVSSLEFDVNRVPVQGLIIFEINVLV
jgi:hypothetical protein